MWNLVKMDRSKIVHECETIATLIDALEGSRAHATMINKDNLKSEKDSTTSHVYDVALYVRRENLKKLILKNLLRKKLL